MSATILLSPSTFTFSSQVKKKSTGASEHQWGVLSLSNLLMYLELTPQKRRESPVFNGLKFLVLLCMRALSLNILWSRHVTAEVLPCLLPNYQLSKEPASTLMINLHPFLPIHHFYLSIFRLNMGMKIMAQRKWKKDDPGGDQPTLHTETVTRWKVWIPSLTMSTAGHRKFY